MSSRSGAAALLLAVISLRVGEVASFVGAVPRIPLALAASARSSPARCWMSSAGADTTQTPSLLMDEILRGNSTAASAAVGMLMDDVLRGNATAASAAVEMLMEVRGTEKMEGYLADMLPPERGSIPLWARLPLSKFSRRARQLRLRKLLDISTPATSTEDEDDEESQERRARRSLFILLRNMADNPDYDGISSMLAMAKRDQAGSVSSEEMLQRTPDLETPKYEVLSSTKGGLEVRRYEKFSVCSVTMNELKSSGSDKESAAKLSNPQLSGGTSFGALAGYLFGKNQAEVAMKMTTPVLSEGEGRDRIMSFVLPSDYWDEESKAPKPMSDSAVKVASVDGCDRAVLAFGGFGRKSDVDAKTEKLRDLVESDKEWRAVEDAPAVLAQYNDPFTPPWKRRNEVSVLVKPRQ